jgi:hypothetical protein
MDRAAKMRAPGASEIYVQAGSGSDPAAVDEEDVAIDKVGGI